MNSNKLLIAIIIIIVVVIGAVSAVFLTGDNSDDFNSTNNTNMTNNTTINTSSIANSQNSASGDSSSNDPSVVSESVEFNYQNGEGYYRQVEYSDGNFRQYDVNTGKLIGSSYASDQKYLPSME